MSAEPFLNKPVLKAEDLYRLVINFGVLETLSSAKICTSINPSGNSLNMFWKVNAL